MRSAPLVLLAVLLGPTIVSAQQAVKPSDRAPSLTPSASQSFQVRLTEFRLNSPANPQLSAKELLQTTEQLRKDGKVDLLETIRLSALEHHESMVQFGKQVSVTVGMAYAGPGGPAGSVVPGRGGMQRTTQSRQLGTLVQLTLTPLEGKLLLKLKYEASRLEAESNDLPHETTIVQFNTTLLVEPGQPSLVGSMSSDKTSLLLIMVEQ